VARDLDNPNDMGKLKQHPIRRYCKKYGITQREFAEQVNLSEGFVSQLISGAERCGRNAAMQINELTDGEIHPLDLFTWKPAA